MELKLFTDLIDALGKAVSGLKAIVNLPKSEREAIRRTLDETYRLIDTTPNMVIIRLGDTLLHSADDDFLREAARLNNYNEWTQAEREFRLCRSLRIALRKTETFTGRLTGAVGTKDWNALLQQKQVIHAAEGEVAQFISRQFQQLAKEARSTGHDTQRTQVVRDALTAFSCSTRHRTASPHQTGNRAFLYRVTNIIKGDSNHEQDHLPDSFETG